MGKIGQLGTMEDVAFLCGVDERMTPTIDFGHLNARTFGALKGKRGFSRRSRLFYKRAGLSECCGSTATSPDRLVRRR